MAYIGQRPVIGRYIKLDQISSGFNGSNTGFSMTAGSQAVFPGTARNLLLSLGGVIQEPDTDFTISGSTLTFTTPPVANTTFFGVIYGDMQATGTPSDGTVLPASIASSGHFKIPQLTVNEDGADVDFRVEGDTNAHLLFADASTDRVGIGTSTPTDLVDILNTTNNSRVLRLSHPSTPTAAAGFLGFNSDGSTNNNVVTLGVQYSSTYYNVLNLKRSSQAVGIGTVNPTTPFHVFHATTNGVATFESGDTDAVITLKDNAGQASVRAIGNALTLNTSSSNSERLRIDSSGRLLIGISTARANFGNNTSGVEQRIQLEGTSSITSSMSLIRNSNDANDGGIIVGKTRGTSTGSNTVVQAGDDLGNISFVGADGTSMQFGADIKATVESGVGNDDMPAALVFSTNGGTTSTTERMRIDSSGKVIVKTNGINLENATATNSRTYSITNAAGTTGWTFGNGVTASSHQFVIYDNTAGAARMLIDSSGNLAIKTNNVALSGSGTLRINSGSTAGALNLDGGSSNHGGEINLTGGSNGGRIQFRTGQGAGQQSEKMRLDENGKFMVGVTSSVVPFQVAAGASGFGGENTIGVFSDTTFPTTGVGGGVTFSGRYNSGSSQVGYAALRGRKENGTVDGSDYAGALTFATRPNGGNMTERMRIDSSGNVVPADSLNVLSTLRTQGQTFVKLTGHSTSNFSVMVFGVNSGGHNTGSCAVALGKHDTNNRSLNAAGTVNASGNDYAEYMTKSSDFTLAKGDICGIDANGKLTNKFSESISFVVKSTDPSYVGGDAWGTQEVLGEKPADDSDDLPAYEEKYEAARKMVDRIAFSGQVPVNVTGTTPGQHIIPTLGTDDSITGVAKAEASLSMAEYISSVGKVIALESDGRARIIVKVA